MGENIIRGIYKITNIINNKIYIGQASDIEFRWKQHTNLLNRNAHVNIHLQNSWNKYGEKCFKFEIIYYANDEENLNELERKFIEKYDSNNQNIGYNMTNGGEGYNFSDEAKHKISEGLKGKNSTLSIEDVEKIKMLMYCDMDRKEISKIFGVSNKVLTSISTCHSFGVCISNIK